jgi:hypothetical protein
LPIIVGAICVLAIVPEMLLALTQDIGFSVGVIVVGANVLAVAGTIRLITSGAAELAWLAFGINLGWGMATAFSLGGVSVLVAVALLVAILIETRRLQVPAITWFGLGLQTLGFLTGTGFIFVFLA